MRTHFGERGSYVPEFVMVDTQRLRARMEAAVDTLLALLDEMDGDADAEPTCGEQFCGAADEAEPDEDGEWWLGSTEDANHDAAWDPEAFGADEADSDAWEVAYAPA